MLAATVAGGCHAQEPRTVTAPPAATPAVHLSAAEKQRLRLLEGRINAHCVKVAQSLVDPQARPTAAEETRAFKAADDFVAMARAKPAALVDVGQDVRLFLGDVIENLEGANCDPRMLARLERGFATIQQR